MSSVIVVDKRPAVVTSPRVAPAAVAVGRLIQAGTITAEGALCYIRDVAIEEWTLSGGRYYVDIAHNMTDMTATVLRVIDDGGATGQVDDYENLTSARLRIWAPYEPDCRFAGTVIVLRTFRGGGENGGQHLLEHLETGEAVGDFPRWDGEKWAPVPAALELPSMAVGDVAGGNYLAIVEDGTPILHGAATGWEDVAPSSVSVGVGAAGPSFTAYAGNMRAPEFPGVTVTKEIFFHFQMPHSRRVGSDIIPHLHLHIPDDNAGGGIKFYLEYHWNDIDDTGAVVTTTVSGVIARSANQGINKNAKLSFGTISGAGRGISSILSCRVYRNPSDAADTFSGSVWLKSADVHVEIDSIGSREEGAK